MLGFILSAGLVATAVSATPLSSTSYFPPLHATKGFRLVVNVTDLSTDLDSPVHGLYVSGLHLAPATNLATATGIKKEGIIFYQNGTVGETKWDSDVSTITDAGAPLSPYGLVISEHTVQINAGKGTKDIRQESFPSPYPYMVPDEWFACYRSIPTNGGAYSHTIETSSKANKKGCTSVRLIPECAALPKLPKGSKSSHKYVWSSNCYKDVSAINWNGP